jgi:DNA polymerase-3 subunit beta
MLFEVDKDILLKSVLISDSVISSKNINTVLSNCLFNIENGYLIVTGTDNDIAVRSSMNVSADNNFSFTVNGTKLIQILKELPKGEVIIDIDNNYMTSIKSKSKEVKGIYKILGSNAEEFPIIKIPENDNTIDFDQNVFKEMIRNVIYAASTDSVKPSFNGIFIITEKKGFLSSVASDSRRLSLCTRPVNDSAEIKDGIIIPLKTIQEIQKILTTGNAKFLVMGNQCYFQIGHTEIISRLVDGQFPNYKQVIPKDYSQKVVVSTKKLIESLRRVMIFTKEPSFKIVLNFSKNLLTMESKTPELGEASEEVIIESSSDEKIKIGINAQYLMDSIKDINALSIEICITGQMSPVTIIPENDNKTVAVIMPIQIKNTDN